MRSDERMKGVYIWYFDVESERCINEGRKGGRYKGRGSVWRFEELREGGMKEGRNEGRERWVYM